MTEYEKMEQGALSQRISPTTFWLSETLPVLYEK